MSPFNFENLPARYKILVTLHTHGPLNFTKLLETLHLSRNTISLQLTQLRNSQLIEVVYQKNLKINLLTTKGKLLVLDLIGDEKQAKFLAYQSAQSEIKQIRDEIIYTLGSLDNNSLIESIQFFLDMDE